MSSHEGYRKVAIPYRQLRREMNFRSSFENFTPFFFVATTRPGFAFTNLRQEGSRRSETEMSGQVAMYLAFEHSNQDDKLGITLYLPKILLALIVMRTALVLLLGAYVVAAVALPVLTTTKAFIPNERIADTAPPWRRATPTAAAVIADIIRKDSIVDNKPSEPNADTAPAWRREVGTLGADTAPAWRRAAPTGAFEADTAPPWRRAYSTVAART
ncbi:hypothetical protein DFH06DRAFT_1125265 [Mycena polygramma]|nr:hypothetical protein DFH06DRAFT_1125265 [Mycena polygramma]